MANKILTLNLNINNLYWQSIYNRKYGHKTTFGKKTEPGTADFHISTDEPQTSPLMLDVISVYK